MLHLIYVRDRDTPVDTAIRGVALDTIRATRAARIMSEHRIATSIRRGEQPERRMANPTPKHLKRQMRDRLSGAMIADWRAAIGVMDGSHGRGHTDARAHRLRPHDREEFQQRWGGVCDIDNGTCVPRPKRLEGATDRVVGSNEQPDCSLLPA